MARLKRAHHRELKAFLVDNYQATNVHLEQEGGTHPALVFFVRGKRYQYTTTERTDSRTVDKDLARFREMLGEPIPKQAKGTTTLEVLTMTAEQQAQRRNGANGANGVVVSPTRDLARRALDWNNKPTEAAKQLAETPPEPTRLLNVISATAISILGDDVSAEYDFVFNTRRKQVNGDGQIVTSLRPVAAVSVLPTTVLELFDQLEPIVQMLRPAPEPSVAPAFDEVAFREIYIPVAPPPPPEKKRGERRMTPPGIVPVGYDAIIATARQLREARDRIAAETGYTIGAKFNIPMSKFLRESGLNILPAHVRHELNWIGSRIEEFERWGEGRKHTLTNLPLSKLIHRFRNTAEPPPPEPKTVPVEPKTVPVEPTVNLVKRSHHKRKPEQATAAGVE